MELIQHQELASATSSIVFSDIPQDYDDLKLLISWRSTATGAVDLGAFYFNTDTGANYEFRILVGGGSGNAGSATNTKYLAQYNNWSIIFQIPNSFTANTFTNHSLYIPNYSLTNNQKIVSADVVTENNATASYAQLGAGLWRNTSAINKITFTSYGGNWTIGSSVSLYGVTGGSDGITSVS